MLKNNKGYSLIEIGVGIMILTVFLLFSVGLFSGCYNNYRRIKARNLAVDRAVNQMERILQTSSDELTGFFIRNNANVLVPNPFFEDYILENFSRYKAEYAKFKSTSEALVETPDKGSDDLAGFIVDKKDLLINSYIRDVVSNEATTEEQLQKGTYAFLNEDGPVEDLEITLVNEDAFETGDAIEYVASNNGALKIVTSINRIPAHDGRAFGNNVLKAKFVVYYTKEFKRNMKDSDMETITLESVKVE